jgi:predicted RNase H-like HicB family nuclease
MVGGVKPVYTAVVEPDHGWWAIRVAELPGVFSQAKRLDKVEGMTRDAIALFLDIAPESFDVVIRERLSPEAERVVADALQARAEAVERQKAASEKVRLAVEALAHLGLPQRDIGRLLDVSHQRVGQLSRSLDTNVLVGDPARSRRRATRHS